MATIDQLARIRSNRSGAVTDVVARLQSANTGQVVNINDQHIPTGILRTSGLPAAVGTVGVTNFPTGLQRTASLATDVAALSTSFTESSGTITVSTTNLSSIHTFTTTALRNAIPAAPWHVGDVAIVTGTTNGGTYVYAGDGSDQTTPAATLDAAWQLLRTPSGTATANDLATWTLNDGAQATLGALTYNSTTNALSINGQSISLGTEVSLSRGFGVASVTLTNTASSIAVGVNSFTVGTGFTRPASFLVAAGLRPAFFLDGMKVAESEVALSNSNTTVTISISAAQRDAILNGANQVLLTLEWEFITA